MSSTIKLMAKPDRAFPSMETTLPTVIMVKSLVQSGEAVFFSESMCFTRISLKSVSLYNARSDLSMGTAQNLVVVQGVI